jgi:hypothetical protein
MTDDYRITIRPADTGPARHSPAWTWEITGGASTVRSGYTHATKDGALMTASLVLAELRKSGRGRLRSV